MAVDTTTVDARARLRQVPVQELVLPVVIIALIIVGMIIRPGVFLTSDNLLNVLTQASITGIIAIGMTFVIATGGIDLSVGSALAAASIAGGLLMPYGSWMFMIGALGMALLIGAVNGAAIVWGKVVPFIATLAMLAGTIFALVDRALGTAPQVDPEAAVDLVLRILALAQRNAPSSLLCPDRPGSSTGAGAG